MHSSLRPSPATAIALVAFLVSVGGFGGSAFAAVAERELVDNPSATNSIADKSVTATCPAGKKLVGTGGYIASPFGGHGGQVALRVIRPNSTLTAVTVIGREDESGFTGNWSVHASAICATPPLGLQRSTATSASNSTNKSATATCPTGKKVLGAGGEIAAGGRQVSMVHIRPNSTLTAVTVTGAEDGTGFAGNWSVRAYAICATPPRGLQRVAATSASDSSDKVATATCPTGKGLVGTGGEITGGVGQVVLDLIPFPTEPMGVDAGGLEDDTGFAGNWSVTSYAICAAVSKRVVAQSPTDSSNKGLFAQCPGSLRTTGVGGDITGSPGQVPLVYVGPTDATATRASAGGAEDETGFSGNWFVRAYAICATPLSGLEIVATQSPTGSPDFAQTEAFCPAGKQVVGAGGDVTGFGQVILNYVFPFPNLSGVRAAADEDPNGYAGNWFVRAWAICATPPAGLEWVIEETPVDGSNKSVTATCPPGKNLLGGGAHTADHSSVSDTEGRVVLDDLRPDRLLRSVTATALVGEAGLGVSEFFDVAAYAICANP
jgi:hypothetical protein